MSNVFIVAEIGINHNGNIDIVKKLIDVAKGAGCDAVKFQKRTIEEVYTKEYLDSHRESSWGTTQRAQKEGLEFGFDEYQEIDRYCKQIHIPWFASAWDTKSQIFLRQFDLKYNKIASAMIVYKDLLKLVASEGRHTFISTGMSTIEDIAKAVKIFQTVNCSYELMHCVSTYPTDPADANLKCIETLRNHFHCGVGFSDHGSGLAISNAAVAFGITSLERHITLDRAMYGSDQAASIEPAGLCALVGAVRKIEVALGTGKIGTIDKEIPIAKKLRAHICENDNLFSSEIQIFSQNGEDGILQYIFSKVGTTNRCFVEFGVETGEWCNTSNLSLNHDWNGLIMDSSEKNITVAKQYYADKLKEDAKRVCISCCFVTAENIERVLFENGISGEIDLLSIDIDGNDYWVWKAIQKNNVNPRVVVIEYNASFDYDKSLTVPYDPNFDRHEKHSSGWYHGASLTALTKLAQSKGYCLIGCDSTGVNAFFVRHDVAKSKINSMSVQEAYYPQSRRLKIMTLVEQFEHIKHLDFVEV